jgi:methyl-accepting chemotaxis protein
MADLPNDRLSAADRVPIAASVFFRATAIAGLCALIVAGPMAWMSYRQGMDAVRHDLTEHASQVTPLVGNFVATALQTGRRDTVQTALDGLISGQHGPNSGASVIDARGDVIARAPRLDPDPALADLAQQALAAAAPVTGGAAFATAFPILSPQDGHVIGALATSWDAGPMLQAEWSKLGRKIAVAVGVFLLALVAAALMLRTAIARPLLGLNDAMGRVASGDYAATVPTQGRRDELGMIARSLERFRASLAGSAEATRIGLFKGAAFESSSAALMIADHDGCILFVNAAARSLFSARCDAVRCQVPDFDIDRLIGSPITGLTGTEAFGGPQDGKARLIAFGPARLSLGLGRVAGPDGALIGFVAEWTDVTGDLESATILSAIDSTLLRAEISPAGLLLRGNANFLAVSRLSGDDSSGSDLRATLTLAGDAGAEPLEMLLGRRDGATGRFTLSRRDGDVRLIEGRLTPVPDFDGSVRQFLLLGTDITDVQAILDNAGAERRRLQESQQAVVDALRASLAQLAEGDLTATIDTAFGADHEPLRRDFNAATARLRAALREVAEGAVSINAEAQEIAASAEDVLARTERQAATLEQTAAALDQLTASVRSAAEGAGQADRMVVGTRENAVRSGAVVRGAVQAMGEIEASSGQISRITGVIEEIAFQTNLLALNAGVEAARAGDAGRGFAVVASEVRALAQRSSDAAREIAGLIAASSAQVRRGVELVGEAGRAISVIETSVQEISACVSDIAVSAREQSVGLGEINTAVNDLDQVTQRNAAMFQETTASSQALCREALALSASMARFRTGDGADDMAGDMQQAAPPAERRRSRAPDAPEAAATDRRASSAAGRTPAWPEPEAGFASTRARRAVGGSPVGEAGIGGASSGMIADWTEF